MAAISVVTSTEVFAAHRWDAEAYSPELRRLEEVLKGSPCLGDKNVSNVSHPAEIIREYTDCSNDVPFVLAGNIKPILPDLTDLVRIPASVAREIPSNRLETGDVLVTRTGANHGVACVYLVKPGEFYTSGEGLIVRTQGTIDSGYLAVLLGCRYGLKLCQKAAYGSGQPHIGPAYLRLLPILRLGALETKIGDLVREAWSLQVRANPLYENAEGELLERLGWSNLVEKKHELFYIENFENIELARRCDAEHYQPQYKRLRKHLFKVGSRALGDFCPNPHRGTQPTFVYSGDTWVN